ncbi:MAG: lytic transglycosylase domain-containing protein [Syntrophorhabdaceae bacterium]|nr:lytic transglycosylase domain-containing protein [Syntrophorhabdaceae bacterium]
MFFRTALFILLIFALSPPLQVYAGIYGYIDSSGVYHFTNIVPVGRKYHVIVPEKNKSVVYKGINNTRYNINNTNYDKLIRQHSTNHGVDPSLIKAIMMAESNFNPYAVSPKGAQGLMQLMPDTARLVNVDNPFDPNENIKGGIRYIKMLDEIFNGELELILAAYNAGPARVIENRMNVPPIEETKTYIKKVKHYYNKLKKQDEN